MGTLSYTALLVPGSWIISVSLAVRRPEQGCLCPAVNSWEALPRPLLTSSEALSSTGPWRPWWRPRAALGSPFPSVSKKKALVWLWVSVGTGAPE